MLTPTCAMNINGYQEKCTCLKQEKGATKNPSNSEKGQTEMTG